MNPTESGTPTLTFSSDAGQLDSIAMIPFSIEPLNYTQPTGCISNKDLSGTITLELDQNQNIVLYAINYGILIIKEGSAYSQNY